MQFVYIRVWVMPGDFLGFPGFPNVKGTPPREHYISHPLKRSSFIRLLRVSESVSR